MKTITDRLGNHWLKGGSISELRNLRTSSPFHGYVYAAEMGEFLKIGHTANIFRRMRSHQRLMRSSTGGRSGTFIFSPPHTNHRENVKHLHTLFNQFHAGKKGLFKVCMSAFIEQLPPILFEDGRGKHSPETDVLGELIKDAICWREFACAMDGFGYPSDLKREKAKELLLHALKTAAEYEREKRLALERLIEQHTQGNQQLDFGQSLKLATKDELACEIVDRTARPAMVIFQEDDTDHLRCYHSFFPDSDPARRDKSHLQTLFKHLAGIFEDGEYYP